MWLATAELAERRRMISSRDDGLSAIAFRTAHDTLDRQERADPDQLAPRVRPGVLRPTGLCLRFCVPDRSAWLARPKPQVRGGMVDQPLRTRP